MPPTEVCGLYSTFGDQVSRLSEPKTRIGRGTRTNKIYSPCMEVQYLGQDSPPSAYKMQGAFGCQVDSNKSTAPAWKIGSRYALSQGLSVAPGPGAHGVSSHLEPAMGKQVRAERETEASYSIGKENRFPDMTAKRGTPAAGNPRAAKGWIGDAPCYTFYNKAGRYELGKGLPGQRPMSTCTPGAGRYDLRSSMGAQVLSTKASAPRGKFGSDTRDKYFKQFVSTEHETMLLGRGSPGPCTYEPVRGNGAMGTQLRSRHGSKPAWGFGSGDRFSQAKARPATVSAVESHYLVPGPGSYRV